MTDTKEVFEMITRTRPDDGALARQHRRQERRRRNERALVFAVAAVIVAASAVGIVTARRTARPATSPTPAPASTRPVLEAVDVATGAVVTTIATDVAPYRSDVSPDGTSIAFVRPAAFGHGQIFVMRLDGTHERQVTGLPGQRGCGCGAIDPAWSPDGTTIAFGGMNLRGGRDIYLLDAATGSIEQLTHTALAGESNPTWSPDGRSITFERGTPRRGCCGSETTGSIVVMSLHDGRAAQIVSLPEAAAPAWSPDGRWIAFSAIRSGGAADLWLVRPDGSGVRRLIASGTGDETAPAWSPDGSAIAFDKGQSVAVVDVASGAVRTVAPIMDASWSGDGRILYGWRT